MKWHSENQRENGVLCHPSDGKAWKHFDQVYPQFAAEPRNVRLGLCADGFTPFNQSAAPYSCWPVIVTPYNLPPELCMMTPYMFLTLIIPGPDRSLVVMKTKPRGVVDDRHTLEVAFQVQESQATTTIEDDPIDHLQDEEIDGEEVSLEDVEDQENDE
ncbi:hypothetical protein QL285_072138 [Trifolium repens]|nr:hypothetical protein QL285_072138 [Trifolium repens]